MPNTKVMGILNITPDSFSDGGQYSNPDEALRHAREMIGAGASILDIGAESTRPGASPVDLDEEAARLEPILARAVKFRSFGCLLSIDTSKPEIARQCLSRGFNIVNDVTGLTNPKMREVVKEFGCSAVVMHQGPGSIEDIRQFFKNQIELCVSEGIKSTQLIIDPGLGFGKTPEQNWEIVTKLNCRVGGQPLLIGPSRKSFSDGKKKYTTADTIRVAWGIADIIRLHDLSLLRT